MTSLFQLDFYGGALERRYRRLRPEVERMPWGTLDVSALPPAAVVAAQKAWTLSAFQEHRTAAACGETLAAMIAAQAPLDLIAAATRFPLDELVHVELCGRLATELGGCAPLVHDAAHLLPPATSDLPPLLHATELVVRYFCVGEAISVPLLRGTWQSATHPLVRAILRRIVVDEATHGQFGWWFLDWALPQLDDRAHQHLSRVASATIEELERSWLDVARAGSTDDDVAATLGWLQPQAYLALAREALRRFVLEPLRARGIAAHDTTVTPDARNRVKPE